MLSSSILSISTYLLNLLFDLITGFYFLDGEIFLFEGKITLVGDRVSLGAGSNLRAGDIFLSGDNLRGDKVIFV
tara:strand:- start:639 stop:860 length:222 start_codon:yes stop_codon:yes gene_type:complete